MNEADRLPQQIDREIVEDMVTAVLTGKKVAQDEIRVYYDLTEREERLVRAGASIIAGLMQALPMKPPWTPLDAWKKQLEFVRGERASRPE